MIYSTAIAFFFVGIIVGYVKWYKPPYNDDSIVHNFLVFRGLHQSINCPICGPVTIKIDADIEELENRNGR